MNDLNKEMASENKMDDYEKVEIYNPEVIDKLKENYKSILGLVGEDPEREGLLKTPERVAKAMQFLTHGYDLNPEEILRSAMFKEDYRQMVIVKDIEIYSLCEHHMLPFIGKAHVAYIPNGHIVGLSKIPRVVDAYSRRLQVQERLTTQIKDCIQQTLKPLGVAGLALGTSLGVVVNLLLLTLALRKITKNLNEIELLNQVTKIN